MGNDVRELVIVGAGPAGITAAIYASRAMLDAVTIEQTAVGGQVLNTTDIDNYPGTPKTTGFELMDAMQRQAVDLGAEIVSDQVLGISRNEETGLFEVRCYGETYRSKTLIVATGAVPRHAGFDGEEKYGGRGVSYCGTCDGMFYRGKQVFVIGGGNTACEDALFLTRFATKVTMVVRKDHLRAQAALQKQVEENEKIEVRYLTSITAVDGNTLLTSVTLRDNATGEEHVEEYEEGSFGVFVFVGHQPVTELLEGLVELAPDGAVITNDRMETSTPGLFCAGDVRQKPLRQIVTAAADGAIAATCASSFLGYPVEG